MAMETAEERARRLGIEEQARRLAKAIAEAMPGKGFALFVFDLGSDGKAFAYMSNGERADVKRVLGEFIARGDG